MCPAPALLAQETFPVQGVSQPNNSTYAFTHATLVMGPGKTLSNATLLVKEGKILAAASNVPIPSGALVFDLKGKYLYPSFIDLFSQYGMPEASARKNGERVQYDKSRAGLVSWNDALMPDKKAAAVYKTQPQQAEEWRRAGFGFANVFPKDGIMRGTSALVALGNGNENALTLSADASAQLSFEKGSSQQEYPSSLMGAIALIRQTYLDAEWYAAGGSNKEANLSLEAVNKQKMMPTVFDCRDKYNLLRAAEVANAFRLNYLYKTSGNEYVLAAELARRKLMLLVPLAFPQMPDVENPYDAAAADLSDLRHWEQAPFNASMLEKAGVKFCLTAADLNSPSDFLPNLRKAVGCGLSESSALAALTTLPAAFLQRKDIGNLEPGSQASFFICNRNLFHPKARIESHWVMGVPYPTGNAVNEACRGTYSGDGYELRVLPDDNKRKINSGKDSCTADMRMSLTGFTAAFGTCGAYSGCVFTLSDSTGNVLSGYVTDTSGVRHSALLTRTATGSEVLTDSLESHSMVSKITYPNLSFGRSKPAEKETLLFTHATVWTNTEAGILQDADVMVQDGKISGVGKNLPAGNARVVNATGMHITPGIIDEHSHIAISGGVNEGTHASSAEVRIGDVLNPDDINIYRQLSGGVTAAQLLHGSANPIGGQSGLIKLRWGSLPAGMKIEGADGFIKFALGENVKQSNWGDRYVTRFPQTRMGVEQVYTDCFNRAKEYARKKKTAASGFRRDLGMECLQEILEKKRFISCHSYQQGEINMLMHVADSFGFRINTFTHILEGYKVADKMKQHGVGASTFSDWWAYKFEVMEAIPYNAALLSRAGIVTAVNSDDAEMARRLNQEAAKAIKYGNLSAEEALKLCTLNPAKLLHLDGHVGSISKGMDADIVVWSDDPLSLKAKAMYTLVDGAVLFNRKEDGELRAAAAEEKNKLIRKMVLLKNKGAKTVPLNKAPKKNYHCDDIDNYGTCAE